MEIARKTLIKLVVISLFALFFYLVYLSRVVLLYVAIALLLSISIYPLMERFNRRKVSKKWSASIIMIALVFLIVGILSTIVTPLIIQGTSLVKNLPLITARVTTNTKFMDMASRFNINLDLTELSQRASAYMLGSTPSFLSFATHFISIISGVVIVIVLTFIFLIDGENNWDSILKLFPTSERNNVKSVGSKIKRAISGFISGNLIISLIAGSITLLTLLILHVPYALALSALVALFDLIPLIGAAIATVVVGFVALTQGVTVAIIAVGVLLVYQFIEGHFIQTIIYSKSINLSPLFIVLASIIGAEIMGITGVLLAIPVGAILQIVSKELSEHYINHASNK